MPVKLSANPGAKKSTFLFSEVNSHQSRALCLPLLGISRRWWRRKSAGRRRGRCAGWRRRVAGWRRWRRDSSIGPRYTWDLIPLCIHTLHVGIVIPPLECVIVCIRVPSDPLASPLPANHVIGLEYFKGLPRARQHHDSRTCRNRCTGG